MSDPTTRASNGDRTRDPKIKNLMLYQLSYGGGLVPAGFEPAHPKIIDLESIALDHSAIVPLFVETHLENINKSLNDLLCVLLISLLRGLNPRPSD